jgi:DNA processing protein
MPATMADNDEVLHWLALKLIPGLGTRRLGQLVKRFPSPQAIFTAPVDELRDAGTPPAVARSIASGCTFEDAVLQHQLMIDAGTALVPIKDPRYPSQLREIHDPPVVLFARGRIDLLASIMIGVVGTRRPTPYGVAVTERLSRDLAQAHLTIVSGMARGIDTAAHRAALELGKATIAVFGCGVDRVYPAENKKLAKQISEEGLLLSEFPMGTPAHPQNFPVRNRIVSGMSVGVLVVEGAQYSGSSITARLAMEQGREVFAVPGNITSKMSWGPNLLIKQGAKLTQEWTDVLEDLPAEQRRALSAQARSGTPPDEASQEGETGGPVQPSLRLGPVDRVARQLLGILSTDVATQIDELLDRVEDCTSSEVIATLFELEMAGTVRQLPGKNFVKVW